LDSDIHSNLGDDIRYYLFLAKLGQEIDYILHALIAPAPSPSPGSPSTGPLIYCEESNITLQFFAAPQQGQ
jgi:hypothetical protein